MLCSVALDVCGNAMSFHLDLSTNVAMIEPAHSSLCIRTSFHADQATDPRQVSSVRDNFRKHYSFHPTTKSDLLWTIAPLHSIALTQKQFDCIDCDQSASVEYRFSFQYTIVEPV